MELAVNQFTKGLQIDTNPMIQGNDSLTDCLNGTLITMNGDEIILQNDMGNRKVDHAYLQPGYEPVGIKEYGGVIYVASYNPITKRSQIGSFPSPLRKYNTETLFKSETSECGCKNNFVNITPLLIKISDNPIHVGDKFVFKFSNENDGSKDIININNISNRNNTTTVGNVKKIISPKNKQYTLSIGILNDLGNFYDITSKLCRWDDNGNIKSYTNESDLYKFNDGYFILGNGTINNSANAHEILSLNEGNIEENRFMGVYANTYSEKFIGPLYLKIEENYILNFLYDLEAYKDEDVNATNGEVIKMIITGKLTYNCPDGISDPAISEGGIILNSRGDDIYKTYSETFYYRVGNNEEKKESDFEFFELSSSSGITITKTNISNDIKYDKITNLYTAIVKKEYEIEETDVLFNYDIKVLANYDRQNGNSCKYLEGISSLGNVLDPTKINSNSIELKGWRFKNDVENRKTVIKYDLEAYPSKNIRFTNLTMYFVNVADNTDIHSISGLSVYNGINEVTIDWDEIGLEERKLYDVSLYYNILNTETGELLDKESKYRKKKLGNQNLLIEIDPSTLIVNPLDLIGTGSGGTSDLSSDTGNELFLLTLNTSDPEPDFNAKIDVESLWLLTTPLLNDCFETVKNYCELDNNQLASDIIKEKLKIKYNISFEDIVVSLTLENVSYIGQPFAMYENDDIDFKCKHEITFNVNGKYKVNFDKENYPDFVNLGLNFTAATDIITCNCDFVNNIADLVRGQIDSVKYGNESSISGLHLYQNNTFDVEVNIIYYDWITGIADSSKNVTVSKELEKVKNKINDILPISNHMDYLVPSIVAGIDEYNISDAEGTYQFYAFGVIKQSNNFDINQSNTMYSNLNRNIKTRLGRSSTADPLSTGVPDSNLNNVNEINALEILNKTTTGASGKHKLITGLFPALIPTYGENLYHISEIHTSYTVKQNNTNTNVHARVFIKTTEENEFVLLNCNELYYTFDYIDDSNDDNSIIKTISDKLEHYNGHDVYYIKGLGESQTYYIYVPTSKQMSNEFENLEVSIYAGNINNNAVTINCGNVNINNHDFTKSLSTINSEYSEEIKVANIQNNNLLILNERFSEIHNDPNSIGTFAKVGIPDSNNYTLIYLGYETYKLGDFFYNNNNNYVYIKSRFSILNNTIDLKGLPCEEYDNYTGISVAYDPNGDLSTIYSLTVSYPIKLTYPKSIDLDRINIYYE